MDDIKYTETAETIETYVYRENNIPHTSTLWVTGLFITIMVVSYLILKHPKDE